MFTAAVDLAKARIKETKMKNASKLKITSKKKELKKLKILTYFLTRT